MKALILNSGLGSRMGDLTKEYPKCMSILNNKETILSRQLKLLKKAGIDKFIITTGAHENKIKDYISSEFPDIDVNYVYNDLYKSTNYIYSIYLAERYTDDDIILIHGDLVFEDTVVEKVLNDDNNSVIVSFKEKLPEKDFKAVLTNNKVSAIGIEFFDNAVASQPFYKLCKKDWKIWLNKIKEKCETGNINIYAEKALNEVLDKINIKPIDINDEICKEVDTVDDLEMIKKILNGGKNEENSIYGI